MSDLFEREQKILNAATERIDEIKNGVDCSLADLEKLTGEYARLLRQLRRITKISDRTTEDLNASKLDLIDKVHYDTLTGIYSRRFMDETLTRNIKSLSRSNGTLSILMIDVDNFKKYNDTYGHDKGDDCLKAVASALNKSIKRPDDFVARYGGEEFIAVLPNTDRDGSLIMAERMLANVVSLNIEHEKNMEIKKVTVSIGGTSGIVSHTQDGRSYIKKADEALYLSKRDGRNRYTYLEYKEEA